MITLHATLLTTIDVCRWCISVQGAGQTVILRTPFDPARRSVFERKAEWPKRTSLNSPLYRLIQAKSKTEFIFSAWLRHSQIITIKMLIFSNVLGKEPRVGLRNQTSQVHADSRTHKGRTTTIAKITKMTEREGNSPVQFTEPAPGYYRLWWRGRPWNCNFKIRYFFLFQFHISKDQRTIRWISSECRRNTAQVVSVSGESYSCYIFANQKEDEVNDAKAPSSATSFR